MIIKKMIFFLVFCLLWVCAISFPGAHAAGLAYDTHWNPQNFMFDSSRPYCFPLSLPDWSLGKNVYSKAELEVSFMDQWDSAMRIYAAVPGSDTGKTGSYTILLGTMPYTTGGGSGTARFNLLGMLDESTFNALFKGQDRIFLMASSKCSFDSASLLLTAGANPVPIPPAFLLFGSGLVGLVGFKSRKR
jgi:hypothetical protein